MDKLVSRLYNLRKEDPKVCKKKTFRTHDIGREGNGHIVGHARIACQRKRTGKWVTQAYRLPKDEYDVKRGKLVPKTARARKFLKEFEEQGFKIKHKGGNDFKLVK